MNDDSVVVQMGRWLRVTVVGCAIGCGGVLNAITRKEEKVSVFIFIFLAF